MNNIQNIIMIVLNFTSNNISTFLRNDNKCNYYGMDLQVRVSEDLEGDLLVISV